MRRAGDMRRKHISRIIAFAMVTVMTFTSTG